ncbi:RNA polymerase sigma factor [Amycolatopsis sp. NPDC051071]|uniref:RNA polymerase sigma factor n=1 Tax=Amycolatopsis sp. NPDC051071 TaxID=3154637 RepID=UPI00342A5813
MQVMKNDHERAGSPGLDRPDLGGPDPAPVFGMLFDAYAAPLQRYLARRVGTETAHDLVAETFLVALRRRETYRPEAGTARAWLYGIATNLLRHHVRTETRAFKATARLAAAGEAISAGHDGRVAERVDAQQRAAQLAGALAALSEADRDTLLLVSWAGLEPGEVAEALGIPAGTVRSRLHRVRRWLRANAPEIKTESTKDNSSGEEAGESARR